EAAGYPTLCKGRFSVDGSISYLFEDPTSLNAISMLDALMAAGVTALKIEGRQRGRAYVSKVVGSFRQAIDAAIEGEVLPDIDMSDLTEGASDTMGAYQKSWR
ncbi:MAG: U32 family peptidase, partial [Rhodospirillaceae bacterium]|nr:U32 family peptidase [Rhodospirillaceae bacterium]